MLVVHAAKKLRDHWRAQLQEGEQPTTTLGDWYATALFWRPRVALFVNEATLFPVLDPLAPSVSVVTRLAPALATLLAAHGARPSFVSAEPQEMAEWRVAKTSNRSVVGVMNEFTFLAERTPLSDRT